MMLLTSVFVFFLCTSLCHGSLFDTYTGKPVSNDLLEIYESNGLKETCTVEIKPCDENEWRRVDGSCNNLQHPARGTHFAPLVRILPANFHNRFEPRKAESGKELPLPREVCTRLLKQNKSKHRVLNNNVPGFAAFTYTDIGSIHDNENMLGKTNFCCEEEHMNDYACTPNIIPENDPVHKDTGIRCMNSTRPLTYQDFKCTNDEVPSPIKKATTPFDCSQIYNANNKGDQVLRTFKGGELAVEEENGALFPPNGPTASCPKNVLPNETRCFENYFCTFVPVSLLTVWFVRQHNYIASNLAKVNPCWDDELLFQTARDINIAFYKQVYFYEWNIALQGCDHLVKAGIITKHNGFRDIYDPTKSPEVTLEFTFMMRFMHLMQESRSMLYDVHGNFIEEFKTFEATFRMGLLANNMAKFTQSMFRAPCHGDDGSVDFDLANYALPGFQKSIDATAGDINKNRNFGLPPYVDYVRHFTGIEIKTFEDLKTTGLMSDEKVLLLNSTYEHVRDIDLMAGAWCEKKIKGGNAPLIVANILNDNTLRAIRSDRHWYERPNRPHAFTKKQLKEIRKSSLAALMCFVADGVTEIPRNAFFNISPKTCTVEIKPCDENEWRRVDGSCNNLQHPARGTYFAPLVRILPANFHNRFEPRKAESGKELPLPREVCTRLLKQNKSKHRVLNNNVPGFAAFTYTDIGSIHDNENMLGKTNFCCEEEHMNDYACTPNIIPENDPVHKDTRIRCMNSTRPLTYQDFKCTNDEVPSPIKKATTPFDCSQIYNANNKGDQVLRTFKGGELAVEEENGALFPPNGPTASCPKNVLPNETRCFENYFCTFVPVSLLTVWFVRQHNYIASNLAKVNPCWDDELLFQTARDINIAFYKQVYFYEWNIALQGCDHLVKAGIITKHNGFRDIYDPTKSPEVTLEFTFMMRFMHLMQESRSMLYDVHGNFIEEFKTFEATLRMGLLANNMAKFTQSTFRAPCHGDDGSVDFDLANYALPGFQKSIDATAGDINKNRNFGLPPYVDYVRHFTGIEIKTFEDLKTTGLMSDEKVLLLNSTYEHVRDIDLMAGAWCEKKIKGGNAPLIVANILNDNTLRAIRSDRHWYERPNRPHAFTKKQLKEIRKSSLAALMCFVADGVTEIPRNAFFNISPKNPLVPCKKIARINFKAWADDACRPYRCPHKSEYMRH